MASRASPGTLCRNDIVQTQLTPRSAGWTRSRYARCEQEVCLYNDCTYPQLEGGGLVGWGCRGGDYWGSGGYYWGVEMQRVLTAVQIQLHPREALSSVVLAQNRFYIDFLSLLATFHRTPEIE